MSLLIYPLQTSLFRLSQSLEDFLVENLRGRTFQEKTVVAVTSKIVSLAEGRIVPTEQISKEDLVKQEADFYLGEVGFGTRLTIHKNILIPAAGIDESNAEGDFYILYPEKPFESAARIHSLLKKITGLRQLGVVITDSHSMPLRLGVTGIALSYWGISGISDRIGQVDLFGKPLKITKVDVVDGLAAAAVLMMGEGNERCPLAVLEGAPVEFVDSVNPHELFVSAEEDMYYPLYQSRIEKTRIEKKPK